MGFLNRTRLGSLSLGTLFLAVLIFNSFGNLAWADGQLTINGRTVENSVGVPSDSITANAPGTSTVLFSSDTSDPSGDFGFNVDPGTYDLHFNPPADSGLAPVVYSNVTLTNNQNYVVSYSSSNPGVRTFSGVISDQNNNPIPGISMTVYTDDHVAHGITVTDANGHYSINLDAGLYARVRFQTANTTQLDGYSLDAMDMGQNREVGVNLTSGDVVENFKLSLVKLNVIAEDGSGNPVQGARLTYSGSNLGSTVVNGSNLASSNANDFAGVTLVNTTDNLMDSVTSLSGSHAITAENGAYAFLVPRATNDSLSFRAGALCVVFANGVRACNVGNVVPTNDDVRMVCKDDGSGCSSTLSAPGGLYGVSPTAEPSLAWGGVPGADQYNIYRDGVKISSTTDTSFVDSTAVDGTHTYFVTASNAVGESSPSNTITVVKITNVAPVVTDISAPSALGKNVSFNASASFTYADHTDTNTATWDWGDGLTSAGSVSESDGSGNVVGTHSYTSAGSYTITVTVTNSHGQSDSRQFTVAVSSKSTFAGANLSGLNYSNTNLSSLNISGSNLQNGTFNFTNFSGSNLSGDNAPNASFQGADFTGANLAGATFQGSNFTGANFTNANLKGANFKNAVVTNVTWANTICPDGTNSDSHGMTCVGHGGGL